MPFGSAFRDAEQSRNFFMRITINDKKIKYLPACCRQFLNVHGNAIDPKLFDCVIYFRIFFILMIVLNVRVVAVMVLFFFMLIDQNIHHDLPGPKTEWSYGLVFVYV